MKNKVALIIVLLIIAGLISVVIRDTKPKNDKLVIGAILPMTGPLAAYGEEMKYGMELALNEFDTGHEFELRVEDSQGQAAAGLSAYNKLLQEGADIYISALSRVAIPLKDLSLKNKTPMVMSLVSSMKAVDDNNPYVFRIFHNASTAVVAHMKTITAKGFKKIGIVYLNDEFGVSVHDTFLQAISSQGLNSFSEVYGADQVDYRTQIQKLKSQNLDVIVFVGIPPTALQNFIKQKNELGLNVPIIDAAGILPGAGAIKALGQNAEGIYTFATLFDLGKTGESLQKNLINRKLDRTYAVAYGYDTIKYIIEGIAASKGTGKSITESLASETKFDGLAGTYTFYGKNNEDIQPVVIPVQVVNGTFKEVIN